MLRNKSKMENEESAEIEENLFLTLFSLSASLIKLRSCRKSESVRRERDSLRTRRLELAGRRFTKS